MFRLVGGDYEAETGIPHQITFNNIHRNGRVPVELKFSVDEGYNNLQRQCRYTPSDYSNSFRLMMALDIFAVCICALSFFLCLRGLIRAQHLRYRVQLAMKREMNHKMTWEEKFEFLDLWYVMIIANDVLITLGTWTKFVIEVSSDWNTELLFDTCRLLIGFGCLLVWLGILRYLSYFDKYNILILTLKRVLPTVITAFVCASMVYVAFAVFGRAVFAPYMQRFQTFEATVETLFTFINPSAVFYTFSQVTTFNNRFYIWLLWFTYLVGFMVLFNMILANLFVALVTDAYETIKKEQRGETECNKLTCFLNTPNKIVFTRRKQKRHYERIAPWLQNIAWFFSTPTQRRRQKMMQANRESFIFSSSELENSSRLKMKSM